MKCLVTGSEGFIGRNLVERLEKEGHEVVGFDVKSEKAGEQIAYDRHPGDVIFHLACTNQTRASEGRKGAWENVANNIWLTRNLANYAAETGMKFIYTSTASVYGNAAVIPTPSKANLAPLTDYAVAKLAGEHYTQISGADWTIVRLSNVYGPHQTLENPYCGVIGRFMEQARAREPLTVIGDGSQTRDFTFVDDVVNRLLQIADPRLKYSFNRKVFNLSHGQETSIAALAHLIARQYDVYARFDHPERAIDSVKRRCLIPDIGCHTSLKTGLFLTKRWFDSQ